MKKTIPPMEGGGICEKKGEGQNGLEGQGQTHSLGSDLTGVHSLTWWKRKKARVLSRDKPRHAPTKTEASGREGWNLLIGQQGH